MDRHDRPVGAFATTFLDAMSDPSFAARATLIKVPPALDKLPRGPFRLGDELLLLLRVLWAALHTPVLLLFSSRGYLKPELLAIVLLGFLPRQLRPAIVLYGEMFQPNSGLRHRVERLVMRLADRAIDRYVVYTSDECAILPENWGMRPEKVLFYPFFIVPRVSQNDSIAQATEVRGGHIFAGGNSFRDYEPLITAARQMPDVQFYVGTVRLEGRDDLPPNLHAAWFDLDEWDRLLRTAAVVAVPLKRGLRRAAGTLVLLEAMWSRRPLVVTDTIGVRDYVTDGVTGLVVDGSAESFEQALRWAVSSEGRLALAQMGEAGHREVSERFTLGNHCAALLALIDELSPRTALSTDSAALYETT